MAEIALGGLRVAVKKTRPDLCRHEETLTTITGGLQRIVCESCGHLSIRYIRPIAGPIDRRRFARQADLIHEMMAEAEAIKQGSDGSGFSYSPVGVFSSKELVPIRNRAMITRPLLARWPAIRSEPGNRPPGENVKR